jgi:hypothetical protein
VGVGIGKGITMRRKVVLTDDVVQTPGNPPAFMVFCYKDIDFDYKIFTEERDARDFAFEQECCENDLEKKRNYWPIYALWATDWK